jgi:DNA-binding IclR family transcriptional regulator
MTDNLGETAPIHATALGKAVLTATPAERHGVYLGPKPVRALHPHHADHAEGARARDPRRAKAAYAMSGEAVASAAAEISEAKRRAGGAVIRPAR